MFLVKENILFLCLATSLFVIVGCSDTKGKSPITQVEKPIEVKVHTLSKVKYPIWATFTGKTQAVDEVTVLSRVTGELQEKHFKPGDLVKKDQLLFSIGYRNLQASKIRLFPSFCITDAPQ